MCAYTLVDGEARHEAHPGTFQIPEKITRVSVPIGAYVKVGFEGVDREGSERMWCIITAVTEGGYETTLNNDPVVFPDVLKDGDPVSIEYKHILSVLLP